MSGGKKIILLPHAEKQLRKATKIDQIVIAKKIRQIGENIPSFGEEKLQGYKDIFRVRVGNYRIVYKRLEDVIYVVLIGHRKDVYELLRSLLD